ncbi:hypothetical protein [Paraburkholderia sp. J76]|uniref:hypothetical protein n=1 Tax=Paraburkholderia sp. J76 TaxID=2805439 RepID=UPI002ABD9F76|nr:hypothetical protein [Paraburkholderia sp. J76]
MRSEGRHKIVRALVTEPWRADWWIEQERAEHGATYRNDRPPYRDLKREALFYARQVPPDFRDAANEWIRKQTCAQLANAQFWLCDPHQASSIADAKHQGALADCPRLMRMLLDVP